MEKQRKWQLFLILFVIALTIYNIAPTIFYYCKPLKEPLSQAQGEQIAARIEKRVNDLEIEAKDWLVSFCNLIGVKPLSISLGPQPPSLISLHFAKSEEASRLRAFLPRSGSLIPFAPAQLSLPPQGEDSKEVLVQRHVPIRLKKEFFSFVPKRDGEGNVSSAYREIGIDRALQIALGLGGTADSAFLLKGIEEGRLQYLEPLTAQIETTEELFKENEAIGARYAASFTQGPFFADRKTAIQAAISAFDTSRDVIKKAKEKNPLLEKRENSLILAESALKKWAAAFGSGQNPWSEPEIRAHFEQTDLLKIGNRNPFFSEIAIDWENDQIALKLHPDVVVCRAKGENKNLIEQLLIDEIAKITRLSNEAILPSEEGFSIALNQFPEASGYLVCRLEKIAALQATELLETLKSQWHPKHPDLQRIPIVDFATYETLPQERKALCLVICAPLSHPLASLRNHSLYVIAKGIEKIAQNYEAFPHSELARTFSADFQALSELLKQKGFFGYPASAYPTALPLLGDFLFEKSDFYRPVLAATREDFAVRGTEKYALLELSNWEQRLLAENKIETRLHEDLLKWQDEYRAAQVNLNPQMRTDVPKPTRSPFWSNVALSLRKFSRGDERKILHWGLDLSGGKTVEIELRDANQRIVTDAEDLKQGINELYKRVNKMGVSEVSIRQVGHHIVLDFPSSQSLSASELIQASTMYFHVVNEKFSSHNPALAESVNRFLQEIWNEAIVTGKKRESDLQEIAWKHLHGEAKSEAARTLWENGLRLQSPADSSMSSAVDDSISKIAFFRGSDFTEWHGQSHPLLIVFRNFALEGSNLQNIRSSYDPAKGNYLSFEVKSSSTSRGGQTNYPRDDLYAWTSRFSKEKILGTPNEAFSKGRGWRMAVLLNDSVISAPSLDSPLRDSAMISGSFSQREVQKLASDLKAGSLTFTPHILSEKNVSPELGKADRAKGIAATFVALFLVIAAMIAYYRFAGLVASIAVIFNLLILWATLQNLGATLTLAGIAGIILTVAMAVDANVLVFERIKEEFAISKRIASAISAGYKKAFSAIIDSNATTIIAALILLNFDAGPIKSFAVNLIIGIVSSLFTALFMTRFYFNGWVQNPKNKVLQMANWIRSSHIDFLKKAKIAFAFAIAIICVGGSFAFVHRSTLLGMDFTGGFSLHLELDPSNEKNTLRGVEEALRKGGAETADFQVRELNSHNFRLLLGTSMEQVGKPFFQMPLEKEEGKYPFEKNPRIQWVAQALQTAGLNLALSSLPHLDTHWTAMSGQMSDTMRNNALIGLLIAFVFIFIYLSFRFEYKFAAAALICVLHDVLIAIGLIGLLHAIGMPLQIDLNTVAALMTIVGYSLNDTIIIFDRIREEMRLAQGKNLFEVVNRALNATLSRTAITSGTALLVLFTLLALGGASIFSFTLVMIIGIFFGTLSSWFIASPLMLFFHRRENNERNLLQQRSS